MLEHATPPDLASFGPAGPFPDASLCHPMDRQWLHYAFLSRQVGQAVIANLSVLGPSRGRRCKIVTLTPAGAAALAAGTAAGQQVLRRIFGSLDQQQQSDLAELLNSIEATIESTDLPDRP